MLLAAALALSCGDDEDEGCGDSACGPTHVTQIQLGYDGNFQRTSTRACFNDACDEGILERASSQVELRPAHTPVTATLRPLCTTASCQVTVLWMDHGAELGAGDRYEVTVSTDSGDLIEQRVEVAGGYTRTSGGGCEACAIATDVTSE